MGLRTSNITTTSSIKPHTHHGKHTRPSTGHWHHSHSPQSGFDQNRVYSVQVLEGNQAENSPSTTEGLFLEFLKNFRVGGEFVYRYVFS